MPFFAPFKLKIAGTLTLNPDHFSGGRSSAPKGSYFKWAKSDNKENTNQFNELYNPYDLTLSSLITAVSALFELKWAREVPYPTVVKACIGEHSPASRFRLTGSCPHISFRPRPYFPSLVILDRDDPDWLFYSDEQRDKDQELLEGYNALLNSVEFTLPKDADRSKISHRLFEDDGTTIKHEYQRPLYRRLAEIEDGTKGGRFYSWWQSLPKDARRKLHINGTEVTEFDYSGFIPRALYHCAKIDYRDDPYKVHDALDRELVKVLFHRVINNPTRDRAIKSFLWELRGRPTKQRKADPQKYRDMQGYGWLVKHPGEALDLLEAKHKPIADKFYNVQTGHEIMWRESLVTRQVLQWALKDGVVVLPIHDGYLCPQTSADIVLMYVKYGYLKEFGFDAEIDVEQNNGPFDDEGWLIDPPRTAWEIGKVPSE